MKGMKRTREKVDGFFQETSVAALKPSEFLGYATIYSGFGVLVHE
ncbi:hypothetical protein S7335_4044 [Synechococcus sp. PCC 7335]|nr:hypothetical protein S7335_4044 [Synechococcus sp. PCC 7335]